MHLIYDIREAVCCENQLHPEPGLSCCEKNVYNDATATCCKVEHGNTITARITQGISDKVSECCELDAYNKLNEMCCQSTIVCRPAAKSRCCGKVALDEDKQLCCGRHQTILNKTFSDDQCCGNGLYNTKTECCNLAEGVLKRQPINSTYCLQESVALDEDKKVRCGPNKTVLTRKSSDEQCCGIGLFNNKTECCSLAEGVLKRQPINSSYCLQESVYLNDVAGEISSNAIFLFSSTWFSGKSVWPQQKPSSQPNCNEPQTHLCGSSCYNPNEFRCCERNQTNPHWCCAGQCDAVPTVYNPHTHMCCDGCVSDGSPWIDQCCGEAPYGLAQRGVLCCNNTLYKGREDGEECSETGFPYNPAKGTICCSQFHGTPGQHCCGSNVYQPDTEICCDGHRHLNREKTNLTCCGIKAYDIKDPQVKCCAGTLHNLTSLDKLRHDKQCCGSILHNSSSVCCSSEGQEVLYAVKAGFRCCGHLYYNSSLWSCCARKLSPVQHPGQHQYKMIKESRLLSLNNLNDADLCKEMHIGTLESVSLDSVVFKNVLKIHGTKGTVKPLVLPFILKISDLCNSPKMIPGKTYLFHHVHFFADFNQNSDLELLSFIFSKCY
ncbi:uncharacterized protein si:ch211-195m9.3 isoform X3 [Scomber scombrus]|uniref:Uncharacterized protein si:ch211-195m9.3 isoform X3 n=1 Tax=Scomber scombrus TaxID=13677 RepID=A0AAV1NWJ5_SCOSC